MSPKAKVVPDPSIPPEVRDRFGEQVLYSLWGRSVPTLTFRAIVKSLALRPDRVAYPKRFLSAHWAKVGQLALRGSDHGTGFVLEFEYWHIERVSAEDWEAMLGVACALGRDTRGVLIRAGSPVPISFDFAPGEPLPTDLEERLRPRPARAERAAAPDFEVELIDEQQD
jgi:hypothetical protein